MTEATDKSSFKNLSLHLPTAEEGSATNAIAQVTPSGSYTFGQLRLNTKGFSLRSSTPTDIKKGCFPVSTELPDDDDDEEEGKITPRKLTPRQIGKGECTMSEITSLSEIQVLERIGTGSSGYVTKAVHIPTRMIVALKVVRPNKQATNHGQSLMMELQTLQRCTHPNIVSFYGAFFENGRVSILMDFMDHGTMKDMLQDSLPFPECHISAIINQVLKGLQYLHIDKKVIHRDLKPSNILFSSDGRVKLTDFGVSASLIGPDLEHRTSFVGTVSYMSPERLQGKCHSYASDIWSLGLIVTQCALGKFPRGFKPEDIKGTLFWDVLFETPSPTKDLNESSTELVDFVNSCLQKYPGDRPSAEILLKHPFIVKNNIDEEEIGRYFSVRLKDQEKILNRRFAQDNNRTSDLSDESFEMLSISSIGILETKESDIERIPNFDEREEKTSRN
uniref:mitogen-activated protein kinase kinase n=1 Tax=Hirondellea gigas TaxID=1518452 RepID=A0A6A7G9Q8_9CRUS